jgi:group I intron endonuclease|uniref:GIY endonuclease n=1 Tax=Leucoagaricus naucinus TaxID=34434 RepID=A0A8F5GEU5_9AGAR|nr:GIY endonuclease [Leucoagaricus naucinus]
MLGDTSFSGEAATLMKQVKPIKIYSNFKENRLDIIKEEKNKKGVYCLVNKINGNIYIGSSVNLQVRMRNYLNSKFLLNKKNNNMPITKALLKYGVENFAVLIIEYVNVENLTVRETYYIKQFTPYYNILKQGYSSLGFKHTEETKILLSYLAKNRKHSNKTKTLIAKALVGNNNHFFKKIIQLSLN